MRLSEVEFQEETSRQQAITHSLETDTFVKRSRIDLEWL
jgi:hypothetical protein